MEGGEYLASFPGPAQLSVTCSTLAILQVTEAGWGLGTSLGNISFQLLVYQIIQKSGLYPVLIILYLISSPSLL